MTYANSASVSSLKTRKMVAYGEAQLHEADQQGHGHDQPRRVDVTRAISRLPPAATAPRSAPTLTVLAANTARMQLPTSHVGNLRRSDGAQADPGVQRDARARLLHGDHQREGEEREPERAEAELAAGLRVGADPRGVVVGRPGDQPRAEELEDALGAL